MKLDPTSSQKLEFLIEVEGATPSELSSRLLLEDVDLTLLIPGHVDGKKLLFEIPILTNRLKTSSVKARVEVVVKERLLQVWEGLLDVEEAVVVKVTPVQVESQVEPSVKVRALEPARRVSSVTHVPGVVLEPVRKEVREVRPLVRKPSAYIQREMERIANELVEQDDEDLIERLLDEKIN